MLKLDSGERRMRKLAFAAAVAAVLTGCATPSITSTQVSCQTQTSSFSAMVACMDEAAQKNPSLRIGLRAEYLAYADMLADRLANKEIGDNEANYLLAQKHTEIQAKFMEAQASQAAASRAALGQALMFSQQMKPTGPSALDVYSESMRAHQARQPRTTTCSPGLGGTVQCITR